MTDHTAMDNRPDVDIHLRAVPAADPRVPAEIVGEASCRFCPESFHSPDPRSLVHWADEHEASQSHSYTKQEIQESVPVAPPEDLLDDLKVHTSSQRPPLDTPWYKDEVAPDADGVSKNC